MISDPGFFENFERRFPFKLSSKRFLDLFGDGIIVDGRAGGFVLGRRHLELNQGGVYLLRTTDEGLIVDSALEGGEYVISADATAAHLRRFREINAWREGTGELSHIPVTPFTRVLSLRAQPFDKLLWIERGQFVINRRATAKHLAEIEELNANPNGRLTCNLALSLTRIADEEDESADAPN